MANEFVHPTIPEVIDSTRIETLPIVEVAALDTPEITVYGPASDAFRAIVSRPIETNRVIHGLGVLSNKSNSGW